MSAIAGTENVSFYGGSACLGVNQLAKNRGPDRERFDNLLMREKAVALLFEDPASFVISAARPLFSRLSPEGKGRIEMLVTCTESGVDFGKSISTYIHDALELGRSCRLFGIKNACYSGTAGFSTVIDLVLSQVSPDARGLAIAADMVKFPVAEGEDALSGDWSFTEPSGGTGAVTVLAGENPEVFSVDIGANEYCESEVIDTCRPIPDSEAGDVDLPLTSYLDCCESAYREHEFRTVNVSYTGTFGFLSFHTPFDGIVRGAHRTMMHRFAHARGKRVRQDFQGRVVPGLSLCGHVGNTMGDSIFPNLLGTIEQERVTGPSHIGCFSYGSGCCSEFYSGITDKGSQNYVRSLRISQTLNERHELSLAEHEEFMRFNSVVSFGTRNWELTSELFGDQRNRLKGTGRVALTQIEESHRGHAIL